MMPSQTKPNVNTVWGSAGLVSLLNAAKQALGWVAEIPDYDEFNGMINQISAFQKHVNQEGLPVWDGATQYYTSGFTKANGTVYVALQDSLNQAPPALGAANAYWRDMFSRVKDYVVDTGAANAYIALVAPAITVRANGSVFRFKAANSNTTSSTINDGLGAANLIGLSGLALQGGEITAGSICTVGWNSTAFATGAYVLLSCDNGSLSIKDGVHSQHAVAMGQLPFRNVEVLYGGPATGNWTRPAGVKKVFVKVVGAGGGGCKRTVAPGPAGGGGGGVSEGMVDVSAMATVPYTVGGGGAGAVVDGNNGIAGSTSIFGPISATGGGGGTFTGNVAQGGMGVGGTINYSLGTSAVAFLGPASALFGGAGGGGASPGGTADTARPSMPGAGGGGRVTSDAAPGAHGAIYIYY